MVTVPFPFPLEGVTLVSQAGLGLGNVIVQLPVQFTLKVAFPAVEGMVTASGSRVIAAAEGAEMVTLTDLLFPFTVRVPPAAVADAFTVTVPLLLPLAGVAVYPLGAVTVQATLELMLICAEAPPAKVRVVGLTLRFSVVGAGPGLSPPLPPPPQDTAIREIMPTVAIKAASLVLLSVVLIVISFCMLQSQLYKYKYSNNNA